MEKNLTKWSKNSKAFRLFVDELNKRLTQLDDLQKASPTENQELLNDAKNCFHQTKGAAGMFGYDDLAEASAELERYFSANLTKVFTMNLESKALIEQFKRCVDDLLKDKENNL